MNSKKLMQFQILAKNKVKKIVVRAVKFLYVEYV